MQPIIEEYVQKLIENLPNNTSNDTQDIDLVLNSGAFNGSYLAGTLYFLKEMERRSFVKVRRISGCSVGAIGALLYFIDSLDFVPKLYESMKEHFKKHFCLDVLKNLRTQLEGEKRIPDDLCERVNGRLYLCYHDIERNKKVIKSTYRDVNDLMDSIVRSCYVPFFIDHNVVYKKRYMDGINAYIFPREKGRKVLHIELLSYDKVANCFSIRNEKTNFHRILEGLLDIHSFYIKQSNTSMCSYVEDWTLWHHTYHAMKQLVEKIMVAMVWWIEFLRMHYGSNEWTLVQVGSKISFAIFSILLETYCL